MTALFPSRRWRRAALYACASIVLAIGQVRADAGWFASGDTQLRLDLQLLNDAQVIRLPVSYWPLPRAAVRYAVENAKEHFAINSAVTAALARVRARVDLPGDRPATFDAGLRGGQAGLWRDFDTLAREDGEIGMGVGYDREHYSIGLEVTAVTNPADDQEVRADGSQITGKLGNWLFSANEMDRWWGPGHEGSLILSNNARPMPTFMIERAEARPFETKWLSWLGPWRMSFGMSRMEESRKDIDAPLFMAWRVVVMPTRKVEIGFSRTAQFCGRELECNWSVFTNLLVGNDNLGIDATSANEPGNQMAGFDLRWSSPIGNLPYAIYAQYIGEDESGYVPAKYLSQFGAEVWHPLRDGGLLQIFTEYSNTTCSGLAGRPRYGCAYTQSLFNVEGYRYRGRSVGYTADRDASSYALGAIYAGTDGMTWTLTARAAALARHGWGDTRNTVAAFPTDYGALEFGWKGRLLGQQLSADLGVQSLEPSNGERDVKVFGFLGWHHEFKP